MILERSLASDNNNDPGDGGGAPSTSPAPRRSPGCPAPSPASSGPLPLRIYIHWVGSILFGTYLYLGRDRDDSLDSPLKVMPVQSSSSNFADEGVREM